jgi:hypothetical protein
MVSPGVHRALRGRGSTLRHQDSAVLHGLGYMPRLRVFGASQIGDGARDLERAVRAAR